MEVQSRRSRGQPYHIEGAKFDLGFVMSKAIASKRVHTTPMTYTFAMAWGAICSNTPLIILNVRLAIEWGTVEELACAMDNMDEMLRDPTSRGDKPDIIVAASFNEGMTRMDEGNLRDQRVHEELGLPARLH